MTIPIIGVTTRTAPVLPSKLPSIIVQKSYTDAIIGAGGLPVLIPSNIAEDGWKVILERLDGILFTGGGDIATELFNGEQHRAVYGIDPLRDAIELELAREAVKICKPFLGICRGLQIVNVALGGTLYTHIPDQLSQALLHDFPGEDSVMARTSLLHSVSINSTSHLREIVGVESLQVNSLHHQGIKDVAAGVAPVAYSPDGLVEAIEIPSHPFGIAVQWHPEWLTDQDSIRKLFKAFVDTSAIMSKVRSEG